MIQTHQQRYNINKFTRLVFNIMIDITVLCGMLMTACDVSAIGKPWELQHELAKKVADEFFDQGDMEKVRLNAQPIVSHNSFQY